MNEMNDNIIMTTEEVTPEESDEVTLNEVEPAPDTPINEDIKEEAADNNVEAANTEDTSDATKLRNEIERLRSLLEEKEVEQAKILNELGEFNKLFPNIALAQIPKPVWDKVESGLPLPAAYALYEKEESIRQYKANTVNAKNTSLSAGSAGDHISGEYYSPDEVKKMSQKEVHDNFSKIKKSMKYWR